MNQTVLIILSAGNLIGLAYACVEAYRIHKILRRKQ